jgi:hypothetical protein
MTINAVKIFSKSYHWSQVGGTVQYSQHDRRSKAFVQNFLLTAQGDHWKVATDTFRHQEVLK